MTTPFIWTGDLDDDCICRWNGYILLAECMGDDEWWVAVYKDADDLLKMADTCGSPTSGSRARKICEWFARMTFAEAAK